MDFCFTQNIRETNKLAIFVFFPYFSHIMGIHFSHVLRVVWIFASPEIFKKHENLKCLCFPICFSRSMEIHFLHISGIVCISASREICKNHLIWECSVFTYFSRTITSYFPHVLGTILPMWRIIFDPTSAQTFIRNSFLRNFTYFVAGPNRTSAFQIPLS